MDLNTKANEFGKLYAASEGKRVEMVHVFGIVHAAELKGVNLPQFCASAGVPVSIATELRKGMKLAAYVTVKDGVL